MLTYHLTVPRVPTLAILWDRLSGKLCLCGVWTMGTDFEGRQRPQCSSVKVFYDM